MIRPLRHLTAVLALLACVLTLPQGAVVLCLDSGGHVAIEVAGTECADDGHDAAALSHPCMCTGDCGPCEDAPLGQGAHVLRSSPPRESALAAPALAVLPALFDLRVPFSVLNERPPAPSVVPAARGSSAPTVLRI